MPTTKTRTTRTVSAEVRQRRFGLWSVSEAAREIGIGVKNLFYMIDGGLVPGPSTVKPGGVRRYYREADLEELRTLVDGAGK